MTILDSSFLIDYLDGEPEVVSYAEDHAAERFRTAQLALYEVYLGELYATGEPDFEAIDDALSWVQPVEHAGFRFGRQAAAFMQRLHASGASLGFRDGYIAASAWVMNERLVTRDTDFDSSAVRNEIAIEVV